MFISSNLIGRRKSFTPINSMNLGTIFLSPAPKMYNNIDKKYDFDDKIVIIRNKLSFCGFYRCVNSGESLTNLT